MSMIMKLPSIMEEGRRAYEAILSSAECSAFELTEMVGTIPENGFNIFNTLARGDNISFMKYLMFQKGLKESFNLIYIDPPFFTKSNYGTEIKLKTDSISRIPTIKQKAYQDTWEKGMEEYLKMLIPRILLMKDLLVEEGALWVHLDWHAVHYVKLILDEIFGEKNFINEIIWHYKSGGASKRCFARKHDTLLFYAKSSNYYFKAQKEKSYNRGFKPYRFKGVKEFRDEQGWYTMVNRKDVWQLDMVGRTSSERTGYVTQKPEALIERILESCTREGDLCADFFGGSGTMAAAANKLNRKWITCDIGKLATINSHKRLERSGASYFLYEENGRQNDDEGGGKIYADVSLQPSNFSDKMILRVELLDYKPKFLSTIPIDTKFMPIIQKVVDEDSLQLIAYWSVDYRYRDRINRPQAYFYKEGDRIETVYETLDADFGPVGIKVVDIFGNSSFLIWQVEK